LWGRKKKKLIKVTEDFEFMIYKMSKNGTIKDPKIIPLSAIDTLEDK